MNTATTNKQTPTGAGWVNLLLGVWVVISPFALGLSRSTAATWNNIAVGVAIVLLVLVSGWGNGTLLALVVPLGAWLFASPFVLGFSKTAFLWNNVILAFALIVGAAISEGLRSIGFSGTSSRL
jgi:hypothetical protein